MRQCLTLSSAYTGEATRTLPAFWRATLIVLFVATAASADSPQQAFSLRLDAESAGLIQIRGDGVQGIDWPAPGRSSVTVPLVVYVDLPSNFQFQPTGPLRNATFLLPLPLRAVSTGGVGGGDSRYSANSSDRPNTQPSTAEPLPLPRQSRLPSRGGEVIEPFSNFDDDAYQLATLWQPGRSEAVRHWTLIATAVAVLTLGIAAHVDPQRATRWLVVAAVGLSFGIVYAFPADTSERIVPVDGQPRWEWVWRMSSTGLAEVLWTPGLRFVPRSIDQLKQARPVLHLDTAGRPVSISVSVARGDRAVFIRPKEHRET